MEGKKVVDLTIIICAYNARKRIGTTLKYLKEVNSDYLWNVVIVDNNSSDNTADLVREFIHRHHIDNIFLLKEQRQGKTFAWETGLKYSSSRYVMICDDDNWLTTDFVTRVISFLESNPIYQVLGVRTIPEFEAPHPEWFNRFARSYAIGQQYPTSGDVTNEYNKVWGAGTVILRESIQYLYKNGFNHLFKGTKDQGMGEDHELFYALRLAGYKIYYNDEISLIHFVSKDRLDWQYPLNIYKKAARSSYLFDPYQKADLVFERNLKGYLKRTSFYAAYVSVLNIVSLRPKLRYIFITPQPESPDCWFACYFEINRIIGLLNHTTKYPSLLKSVRTAKWRKKV